MYSENEIAKIAKRENNKKRNYLVVNQYQGKHIPVSPTKAIELFNTLAQKIKEVYANQKILYVGFAETATAIGASVAVYAGGKYIQTTRESVEDAEYLFFSESHSHATEQKLVKNDIDKYINDIDTIIFVEDEVTTGNTILNIVNILEKEYGKKVKFAVASLLNGMSDEHLKIYKDRDIELHYVVKTDCGKYSEIAEKYNDNGNYYLSDTEEKKSVRIINEHDYINTRRCCDTKDYQQACERLWRNVNSLICPDNSLKYLVAGTEEFMYPALYIGKKLEEQGCYVRSHSTTRSPIVVSKDSGYPLAERFELKSLYDKERVTFIYNIYKYDKVIVLTDASFDGNEGINSLVNAISLYNSDITIVRWC